MHQTWSNDKMSLSGKMIPQKNTLVYHRFDPFFMAIFWIYPSFHTQIVSITAIAFTQTMLFPGRRIGRIQGAVLANFAYLGVALAVIGSGLNSWFMWVWFPYISGWWCNNHLETYESQWEGWHPIYYGKHVPNHQPNIYIYITICTRMYIAM